MSIDSIVTIAIFSTGTALVGIGIASKDLGWASVVVGGILLTLVVASKLARRAE